VTSISADKIYGIVLADSGGEVFAKQKKLWRFAGARRV